MWATITHYRGIPTPYQGVEALHLDPPHRNQFLRVQHDVMPVRPLVRVVRCLLEHVGFYSPSVTLIGASN